MREYKVTMTTQYQAAGERDGVQYVTAANKREACKVMRQQVARDCGRMTEYGRIKFTAEEA